MAPVSAGTLALWIGTAFAFASAVAALTARGGEPRAWVAGRALTMAAAFSALASGILLDALRRHDLTIDFVARHSTHGVGLATALLGAFSDPAGTGLVTASVIGIVGAWFARRADAPGIAGASAVTMVVLLAAPLAGRPLAVLPWTPLDGQDALIFFRQRLSLAYVIALIGAIVASATALGAAIDGWRGQPRGSIDAVARRVALLCVGAAALTRTWASLAAGLSRDASPLTALGGALGIAVAVALVSVLLVALDRAGSQANVEAALASTLATAGLALTSPSAEAPGASVRVLSFLALGVAIVACWHGRLALSGVVRVVRATRLPAGLGLAALGVVSVSGILELTTSPRRAALPSGGSLTVAGGALDHLGLSRYDDDDSQVLALALERRAGGRTRLASAEHREYADSRGALLGGLIRIPAIMPGIFTTVVWLDEVQVRDDVTLVV
ncbi:MAG: hypothetical protein H7066_08580, partial [Cytophagaceae bacterium]|nr:hypothetical protein [Gemmatimonadaceae bacterium]